MSDENEPQEEELMESLSDIMNSAATSIQFNTAYETLIRMGVMLSLWKRYMMEQGFSDSWCDEGCMVILRKMFASE